MLPILVARQIEEGLSSFLKTAFPVTTPAFQRHDVEGKPTDHSFLDDFLDTPGALFKGPWLEVKLPFCQAAEESALPFKKLQMAFAPYQHQVRAFDRLCGGAARSTLVATGTGSGKTECFMYPLLDHCLVNRGKGIKAIIVYPMNALATDQARRFAKECAKLVQQGLPSLSVGLFTGDQGTDRSMGPEQVITNRETLRSNPPDILLTNYRMLDFLLMRPQDQPLWQHNKPGVLRYLVVDELHTFDGAQGTDLACLIRRLRAKLEAGAELACVGTSATIGGADAVEPLRAYAGDIFATEFEAESIVLEDRLKVDEYLHREVGGQEVIARWPKDAIADLRPRDTDQPESFLARAAEVWLGINLGLDSSEPGARQRAEVELGRILPRLTAFQELLRKAHSLCDVADLADEWAQRLRLKDRKEAETLIDSLCSLVSAARTWKKEGEDTNPFLQVRIQLWLRELRRMVSKVGGEPTLTHADDVLDPKDPLHLPVLHCRECHGVAWGSVKPEGEQHLEPDLQGFYQSWFQQQPDAVLLYPVMGQELESRRPKELRWLCLACRGLTIYRPGKDENGTCPDCGGKRIAAWMPDIQTQAERHGENRTIVSHDCPCCGAKEGMSVVGSRAASLASVSIAELFGSAFNDDHKLIAFSDSVQDAAHRAGFFGARTYSQVLRHAMAGFIRERGQGLTLAKVAEGFPKYWLQKKGNPASFVGTFIAPNMEWLKGYSDLKDTDAIPAGSDIADLVAKRMSWEVFSEFGLRSRIGRTLERSGVAVVQPDEDHLQACATKLATRLREELEQLKGIQTVEVNRFLIGFLTRARQIGAFYTDDLQRYVQEGGERYVLNELSKYMPIFGTVSRPPAMLTLKRVSREFENVLAAGSWFVDWFERCMADNFPLAQNEREQAFLLVLNALEREGWLIRHEVRGDAVWGLDPLRWNVTTQIQELACSRCQHHFPVPAEQLHLMLDLPCMKKGCDGSYRATRMRQRSGVYRTQPHRLVPSEHTGLMEGEARHRVEDSFIQGKREWDVNLLSATPTLEMGIDIGDLSTVMLCSVPPGQANYLQRIGRAGRRDGNALALTIASGKPHDLFFYAEPTEMMAGSISTPGVFLKAMAVLERQLIAFCFDRWVETGLDGRAIPNLLKEVLDAVESGRKDVFPHPLLAYVETKASSLLEGFLDLFPSQDSDEVIQASEAEERRHHFAQFIEGGGGKGTLGWRVLNRLTELVQTRKGLQERIKELKKRIDQLVAQPEDEERNILLSACRNERQALLTLVSSINRRQTLNFFTDEGLLPNYAFPEEGVTLNSVIIRRRERRDDDDGGGSSEKFQLSFQRSAQAALGELVPDAKFYAAEHRLNIDQVDLKLSKPQAWRLCPACQYCENTEETGDLHSACPRCGNGLWGDIGQKRTLLKLRQVYARADARRDRIGDDSDERVPAFYRRQLLVDVPPESHAGAFRIERADLPFGFEYLRSVSFREINFGEVGHGADAFQVAGRNEVRTGFQICGECGMVRRRYSRKGQFPHALDCRFSRPGIEPQEKDWISSLYLYRELQSEAVRILLPLADVAQSEITKQSFVAALMMGLKVYFKGEVHHLDITEMQEPSVDGFSTSQYLVLYDQVPGGTGYLKELMRSPENLLTLLQKAHDRLAICACGEDESKDGCYRCILAYRNSRNRGQISRRSAMKLLQDILNARDALHAVDRLGDMAESHLLESKLEERFIFELGRSKGLSVLKKVVNGKPGYWIHTQGIDGVPRDWELEPQVELGLMDGVKLNTRPDFVLRPVREGDRKAIGQWALYLDGFTHHWNNLQDDTRKRMAVIGSGRRVWSLGWHDLNPPGEQQEASATSYLLKHRKSAQLAMYDKLAERGGWASSSVLTGLLMHGPFHMLIKLIQDPEPTLAQLQQASICNAIAWLHAPSLKSEVWKDPSLGLKSAVPSGALDFYAGLPENLGVGGLLAAIGSDASPLKLGVCIPVGALNSVERLKHELGVHIAFDEATAVQTKEFESDWRGLWHCANVLQFSPRFTFGVGSDMTGDVYNGLLDGCFESGTPSGDHQPDDPAWDEVVSLSSIDPSNLSALKAKGIPLPEVGLDLVVGIETIGTAELGWPDQKVAILDKENEQAAVPEGWVIVRLSSPGWMDDLVNALNG
jgi:DEAD/DEAH box helicase domain-containing protein